MLTPTQNNYKSILIGRLGEFNPELDSERRKSMHKKTKHTNFDHFEDLHYMRGKAVMPKALDRKLEEGHFFMDHISKDPYVNSPHWEQSDHRTVDSVMEETKKIKQWSLDHLKTKEVNPKEVREYEIMSLLPVRFLRHEQLVAGQGTSWIPLQGQYHRGSHRQNQGGSEQRTNRLGQGSGSRHRHKRR